MIEKTAVSAAPISFEPGMEHLEENEAETQANLEAVLAGIRETTFEHSGHATRSVHAKSHGVLRGTLDVAENLPPTLAQGLFSKSGHYNIIMRFSTIPGDMLDDAVSTPRGVAIKVIGVEGPRLPGSETDVTQDFVMVDAPAFSAPSARKFLGSLKSVAGTTDKAEGFKKFLSRFARGTEAILEAFGTKSPLVVTLGGQPATHILGETFYTQTPFLFGPYLCKFSLAPSSASLKALTGTKIALGEDPEALRTSVIEYFGSQDATWELKAQLNTDLDAMPIEDSSVVWPEDKSPYITVAHITVPAQNAWSAQNVSAIDEGASFSPWHGLAAHRPLGGVNRARKATYDNSAHFRSSHNGCPMHEPRD